MAKFKEGDTIRVVRNLHNSYSFDNAEFDRDYLGKDFEIIRVYSANAYSHGQAYDVGGDWAVYEDEIELVADKHELYITCVDGKTTNAVYKINGKIAKQTQARLHPQDAFAFQTGAMIAAARIFDMPVIDVSSDEQKVMILEDLVPNHKPPLMEQRWTTSNKTNE